MLLFGTARWSVLLLSAVVTAAIASLSYGMARPRFGRPIAAFAAAAFILCPITQDGSAEVMLDAPITLLCLLSTAAYARWLDRRDIVHAVLFGLLASAGMLIKGNAACLALLPVLVVLIGRRFDLLRDPRFWLPLPIVAVLTGPWYMFTYRLVANGFRYEWGLNYTAVAVASNAALLLEALGPVLLVIAVAGWLSLVCDWPRRYRADAVLLCLGALAAAVLVFQCTVPAAIQDRYLQPALPPLLILTGTTLRPGYDRLAARWLARPGGRAGMAPALLAVVLAVIVLTGPITGERKAELGFVPAARAAWAATSGRNPVVLVIAGTGYESAAVAELAQDDPHRPSLFALRGSRLLGGGGYNSSEYVPRFQTAAEVMAAIDDYHIPLVLFRADGNPREWAHVAQVAAAMKQYADRWEVLDRFAGDGAEVLLLRVNGNLEKGSDDRRLTELAAPRSLTAGP
jgi:hypothetical protein